MEIKHPAQGLELVPYEVKVYRTINMYKVEVMAPANNPKAANQIALQKVHNNELPIRKADAKLVATATKIKPKHSDIILPDGVSRKT